MDMTPADANWASWLMDKLSWVIPPIGGSVLSILVGKDYSPGRVITGVLGALFIAYYFSDWLTYYIPMPPDTPPAKASGMAGALWGLTSYFVIVQLIDAARKLDFTAIFKLVGGNWRK